MAAIAAALAFVACDDSTSTIGSSLVEDKTEIIEDSSFTISATTVSNPDIMSRTLNQLIGSLDARGYGRLTSDVVTQFMPAAALDTTGISPENVDSVQLVLFLNKGAFAGDSLVPMGINVYRLTRELPSPIYSTFDPTGYYDSSAPIGRTIYTGAALHNDSLQNLTYRSIIINLPRQIGVDIYNEYLTHPETFQTPTAFAKFFPGLYIANSFGSGRVTTIHETRINFYYKRWIEVNRDSVTVDTLVQQSATYLAVTPEVITNNNLSLKLSDDIRRRIDAGEKIITAPTGTDVEFTIPIDRMISSFQERGGAMSVFNSLAIQIPVEEVENAYGINPPEYLLMVPKKYREEFFSKNELPSDEKFTFYATYNSTDRTYTFNGMRRYFVDMLAKEEPITDDDRTFVLTPVDVDWTESQTTQGEMVMSGMAPFISGPAMAVMKTDSSKVVMIYSKQHIN